MKSKIQKLKALLQEKHMDYVAIIPGNSFFYLTGMRVLLHERPMILILVPEGEDSFFLPKLELPSAAAILGEESCRYYTYTDEEGYAGALKSMVGDLGMDGRTVGIEFMGMRYFEYNLLKEAAQGATFVDAEPLVDELRVIKDEEEIRRLQKAAEITDVALEAALNAIRPGLTEKDVLNEVMIQLLRAGSQEPFKTQIVVSGPRSAFPHSKASDRKIEDGDIVMIDTGATYLGYPCDLTRTFALGSVSNEMKKVYETVQAANAAVLELKRPMTAEQVDRAARDVIESAGYGDYFIHRTGHGLGIGGHEAPSIVKGNKLELQTGMTFTDEPGIYLPGVGGVRIEDDVVVTEDGIAYLTHFPRDLRIL